MRAESKKNEKGELGDYFAVKNEYGEVVNFKTSLLNLGMMVGNSFSKYMIGLRADGGDSRLAAFISQLTKCKGFSNSDENVYSDLGFELVGTQNKHNPTEIEEFLSTAKNDATLVSSSLEETVDEIAVKTKRKKKSEVKKRSAEKLSKQERIDKYFRRELTDATGVEAEVVKTGRGRADVPLRHLTVSSQVVLPIDEPKVRQLAKEMLQRFEPTNIYFSVVPKEPFDPINLHENHYSVVHGRHRLLALQSLDDNKLTALPTMHNRTVTCFILGMADSTSLNYLTLRGNDIAARFASKPNHHDLFYTLQGLKEMNKDTEGVMKAITRYANLQKSTDAEKSTLRSLSKWPNEVLNILKQILLKYEKSQLADFDDKKMKSVEKKLKEGLKLVTPISLFKGLAKLPFAYFLEHGQEILDSKISLKVVIQTYIDESGRRDREKKIELARKEKEAKITELAGFDSIEVVRSVYPKQFDETVLDKLPAKLDLGSATSPLDRYTLSVFHGKEDSSELKTIEMNEDLVELRMLLSKCRRDNVKEMIGRDIKEIMFKIGELTAAAEEEYDPFTFKDDQSGVDNLNSSAVTLESSVLEDSCWEQRCHGHGYQGGVRVAG